MRRKAGPRGPKPQRQTNLASSRGATASLVRSLGVAVETFSSAREFLASPASATTTCLITDIHMPEITGLELQGRLRALRPDCPVIVVTGFPTDAVRDMAMANRAVGVFAKPLGADFLACLGSGPIDVRRAI